MKYANEYRITKKGAECFRSTCLEDVSKKFSELSANRAWMYKIQHRSCQLDKHGCLLTDGSGRPLWSCWL
jgi:hypothetical protein